MTDWTEETKSQSPHWKIEDITDRDISRKDIEDKDTTTRGDITKYIFGKTDAKVMRVDIENFYGSKPTVDWSGESKGEVSHSEESKGTVDYTEESKSTVDWSEEEK